MAFSSIPAGTTIYFNGNYGSVPKKIINCIQTENHARLVKQETYYDGNMDVDVSVMNKNVSLHMNIRDFWGANHENYVNNE